MDEEVGVEVEQQQKQSSESGSWLNALPNELKVKVLSYLRIGDGLDTMRLVSNVWKNVVNDSGLVKFNVTVGRSNVETFKKMSLDTMSRINTLSMADVKQNLAPLRPELKKVLLTTQQLLFGTSQSEDAVNFRSPDSSPFHGENIRTIIKACQNVKELEFGSEVLNEVVDQIPVLLRNVRLEVLSKMSITFDSDTDTALVLGILQLNAPLLREFSATRVLICYCSKCSPYFGKILFLGIWKFISRHAKSIKVLSLHNIGSYDLRSELVPPGMTLRKRGFEHHNNTIQNYFLQMEKFQELESKFDATKVKELDPEELAVIETIRSKLKLKSLTIHHKVGEGKTHDCRLLKVLFETQSELEVLKYQASPPSLRNLILENTHRSKNTLVELQIEVPAGFEVKYKVQPKYYEELKLLKIFKLGGHITLADYSLLPSSIQSLTIDASELRPEDYNGICQQLDNLETFILRRIRRPGPPTGYSFLPIFHQLLASLPKLKHLRVGLNILGDSATSISDHCQLNPKLTYSRFNHWTTISRSFYEPNVAIEIQRP